MSPLRRKANGIVSTHGSSSITCVTEARRKMTRTRVLLADDDLQMQACISALLQADFEIVGTVLDGCALVEATLKLRPDVVVTDISMPTMNGIEAVQVTGKTFFLEIDFLQI